MWRLAKVVHLGRCSGPKAWLCLLSLAPQVLGPLSLPSSPAPCREWPPTGMNLLVVNAEDLTFLQSFCTPQTGAAQDPLPIQPS